MDTYCIKGGTCGRSPALNRAATEIQNLPAVIAATMPSSRILVTVLLAAFALPAMCQEPRLREVKQIPDELIYHAFFYRIAWLDGLADKTSLEGKNDTRARSAIRTQANLSSAEEGVLKAIVADWRVNDGALVSAAQAQRPAGATTNNPQQAQALRNQREQMTAAHIAQLRVALGPTRFLELDAFVRRTSTVRRFEIPAPSN